MFFEGFSKSVDGLNNCWVLAKQWDPSISTSTDFFWFSSKNDVQPFRINDSFIDENCLNSSLLGSCLYTNENGKFCNDDCNSKKCFVCEINAS